MNNRQSDFRKDIETYWHSEVRDHNSGSDLLQALSHPNHPIKELEFERSLADAILNHVISADEYEELTGIAFETTDGVVEDLRGLWSILFGSRKILL